MNNIIDYDNKKCLCCFSSFNLNSDLMRHIKTTKHIKNSLCIDTKKCSFCDYLCDNISNLNKHIKTVHREKKQKIDEDIIKVGKSDIPQSILNQYFMLKENANTSYYVMMGKKHRIKMLKNRNFKDDEKDVIDAKVDLKLSIEDYNNNIKSLKALEDKFIDISKAVQIIINDKSEIEGEVLNEHEKNNRIDKMLEFEDLKDDLDELYIQLRNREFDDLQKHKINILNKENEIKILMNELYNK